MTRFSRAFFALVIAGALTNFLPWVASVQHIMVDGRFSPAQTLVEPNYSIGANLGKQVGSNLFHSFGLFGLATGESAAFSGPATVNNIIGRVTGGSPSAIDGKIQSIPCAVANGATTSGAGPNDASGMTASVEPGSDGQAGEIALKAGGVAKAASSTPGAGNGGRAEVLLEACAARAGQPISSLVEAGRGGLPQDPEATLPALYIAGRDLNPNPQPGTDTVAERYRHSCDGATDDALRLSR